MGSERGSHEEWRTEERWRIVAQDRQRRISCECTSWWPKARCCSYKELGCEIWARRCSCRWCIASKRWRWRERCLARLEFRRPECSSTCLCLEASRLHSWPLGSGKRSRDSKFPAPFGWWRISFDESKFRCRAGLYTSAGQRRQKIPEFCSNFRAAFEFLISTVIKNFAARLIKLLTTDNCGRTLQLGSGESWDWKQIWFAVLCLFLQITATLTFIVATHIKTPNKTFSCKSPTIVMKAQTNIETVLRCLRREFSVTAVIGGKNKVVMMIALHPLIHF